MKTRAIRAAAAAALCLSLLASAAPPPALPGDRPADSIVENDKARKAYFDAFIGANRDSALAFKGPKVFTDPSGNRCRISLAREEGAFYAVVENEREGAFSRYAQGSWAIKRDLATGLFVQAKLFLRSDPGIFARFTPLGNPGSGRTSMEVILYGAVIARGVTVPLPFMGLVQAPVSTIRAMTSSTFDWSLMSPDPLIYGSVRAMAEAIRSGLPGLTYGDDGAVEADGRNVAIATGKPIDGLGRVVLNCSGFAKWVMDGLYAGLASGERISIADAKKKWYGYRGSEVTDAYEDELDPYFGLDWVRNLALRLDRKRWPSHPENPLAYDVVMDSFPLVTGYGDVLNSTLPYRPYPGFLPDAGYRGDAIKAILYLLALKEPGNFYLASVNDSSPDTPALRRHYHIAVLFPSFDQDGIFRVDVFESAAETDIDYLQFRLSDQFLFLVRVKADPHLDLAAATGSGYRDVEGRKKAAGEAEPAFDPTTLMR